MVDEKEYKNKVVYLRKSKKGEHLYAFDVDGALATAESLVMNVSDVEKVIAGEMPWAKVSVMVKEAEE